MTDLRPSTHWEDVEEGEELPVVSNSANQTQLLTFSAITWNPHRIHYERDYALSEGHADVIVHGPLQGAWLSQYVTDWIGPLGRMKRLKWQNRGSALVGETVTFRGWVSRKYEQDGEYLVDGEVVEENSEGRVIMPGEFTASLPTRSG